MVKMLSVMAFLVTHGHMGEAHAQDFILQSSAFKNGQAIPERYTCKGDDVSVPLNWRGVPSDAKSLVLIMSDPGDDAGTWYHWVLYNISPEQTRFTANVDSLPPGVIAARNSWGNKKYQGPCPSEGTRTYAFRLYALDKKMDLGKITNPPQVIQAMQNHVLGVAMLRGKYGSNQPTTLSVYR